MSNFENTIDIIRHDISINAGFKVRVYKNEVIIESIDTGDRINLNESESLEFIRDAKTLHDRFKDHFKLADCFKYLALPYVESYWSM